MTQRKSRWIDLSSLSREGKSDHGKFKYRIEVLQQFVIGVAALGRASESPIAFCAAVFVNQEPQKAPGVARASYDENIYPLIRSKRYKKSKANFSE